MCATLDQRRRGRTPCDLAIALPRRAGCRPSDGNIAAAQCQTIREKLLKIGAQVRVTVRKVWVWLSQSCPYARIFCEVLAYLRGPLVAGPTVSTG
jgi:hypothetical protein